MYGDDARQNNIAFMRFLAAFLVVYEHTTMFFYGKIGTLGFVYIKLSEGIVLDGAFLGLSIFFFLSGYLVTKSWKSSENITQYLIKRAFRIYPAFIIMYVFLHFAFFDISKLNSNIDFFEVFSRFTLDLIHLDSYFGFDAAYVEGGIPLVNAPLWTLFFELICYFLTMALGLLLYLIGNHRIYITSICLVIFVLMISSADMVFSTLDSNGDTTYFDVQKLGILLILLYLIGAVFAELRLKRFHGGVFFIACCILFILPLNSEFHWFSANIALVIHCLCFPIIILNLSFLKNTLFNNWDRYGDYSYGIYLYHWPILALLVNYGWRDNALAGLILFGCFTMLVAFLSWHLIEKRFLNLK